MRECLDRIEREKSTLQMICSIFSASVDHPYPFRSRVSLNNNRRIGTGILCQVQENKALIEQQDHRLGNIQHGILQTNHHLQSFAALMNWISGQGPNSHRAAYTESVQTTAFSLFPAYHKRHVTNVTQSSDFILGLQDTEESLTEVEESDLECNIPPECKSSIAEPGSSSNQGSNDTKQECNEPSPGAPIPSDWLVRSLTTVSRRAVTLNRVSTNYTPNAQTEDMVSS